MNKLTSFRALRTKARSLLKAATKQYEQTLRIIDVLSTKAVSPKEIVLTGEQAEATLLFAYEAKTFKGLLKAYPAKSLVCIEEAQRVKPETRLTKADKRNRVREIHPYIAVPYYPKDLSVHWWTEAGGCPMLIQVNGVSEKRFKALFDDQRNLVYRSGRTYCLKQSQKAVPALPSPFTEWNRRWSSFASEQNYTYCQKMFLMEIRHLITSEELSLNWKWQGLPDKNKTDLVTPHHWSEPAGVFWDHFGKESGRVFWKFCLEMDKGWRSATAEALNQAHLGTKLLSELFKKGTPTLSVNMEGLLSRYVKAMTGVSGCVLSSMPKNRTEVSVSFLFADDPRHDYRFATRLKLRNKRELLPRDIPFDYAD